MSEPCSAAPRKVQGGGGEMSCGLRTLQEADSLLGDDFLPFWRRRAKPTHEERQQLPPSALTLLKQWDCLVEQEGVLYCWTFRSDRMEEYLQLVLPAVLKEETLSQLHQNHGHQGIKRTTELVRQHCYWPGMSIDIKQWVQTCERCQPPGSGIGFLVSRMCCFVITLHHIKVQESHLSF